MNSTSVAFHDDQLLDSSGLAEMLGVSLDWVVKNRRKGLPYLKLGKRLIRFRVGAIKTWLAEQQVRNEQR